MRASGSDGYGGPMRDDATGILLPTGDTGSTFLHRVLRDAAARFDELETARLPADPRTFREGYGDAVVRFEAARIASPRRVDIAQAMVDSTLGALRLVLGGVGRPLQEALAEPVDAPDLFARTLSDRPRFGLEVPCDGVVHRGKAVADLVHRLHAQHHLTDAARDGLLWMVRRVLDDGGALDLRGQRFAILGAGAELSPVPMLLAAGASVLWIDRVAPEGDRLSGIDSGELVWSTAGSDLLAQPREAAASIRRFAARGPVHVGLYAYAPGQSRELRIAAGMDALVRSLGRDVVRSVSMLVSPTSPTEMQAEDVREQDRRVVEHPRWQSALELGRALRGPRRRGDDRVAVASSVMQLQGAGYQAAQLLAKIATAEALAARGMDGRGPLPVSANVAGITATRSLAHPLFLVAFAGAPAFGVRIFEPATTRALATLLMLHDLLNPDAPASTARTLEPEARARAVRAAQLHGAVPVVPWQFEASVQAAAGVGALRRPDLLLGLVRPARRPRRGDQGAEATRAKNDSTAATNGPGVSTWQKWDVSGSQVSSAEGMSAASSRPMPGDTIGSSVA